MTEVVLLACFLGFPLYAFLYHPPEGRRRNPPPPEERLQDVKVEAEDGDTLRVEGPRRLKGLVGRTGSRRGVSTRFCDPLYLLLIQSGFPAHLLVPDPEHLSVAVQHRHM